MLKKVFFTSAILCLSCSAWAAPRPLIPTESKIEFTVKEMGVPIPGVFKRFEAAIDINNEHIEQSSANLRIEVGSLDTGSEEADAIAVNSDWLDKPHAPYAIFKSTAIKVLGGGRYEAKGTLSIRNKPRDLLLQFMRVDQPNGKTTITSDFVIKRSEFGIGGGMWNEGGVVAEEIPVKVKLVLGAAAAPSAPAAAPAKTKK